MFSKRDQQPPQQLSFTYEEARERFRDAAYQAGAELISFPISARGPGKEQLTIDVAWIGSRNPAKALLHISGVHGVEGFAGSLIQEHLLQLRFTVPRGKAIVLIHGLNPWGMANLRRTNENNVDLNRNFHLEESSFHTPAYGYGKIDGFLSTPGTPNKLDLFYPTIAAFALRYGISQLKQTIAGGQHEFPNGLFFGGKHLEESLLILRDFLKENFADTKSLLAIEVHTGLGTYGKDALMWPFPKEHARTVAMEKALGEPLSPEDSVGGAGYSSEGDLQRTIPKLLPGTRVSWILQEFGTYNSLSVLRALRNEHRYHLSGGDDIFHWSKQELFENFVPPYLDWEKMVLNRGVELFQKLSTLLTRSK